MVSSYLYFTVCYAEDCCLIHVSLDIRLTLEFPDIKTLPCVITINLSFVCRHELIFGIRKSSEPTYRVMQQALGW